MIHTVKNIFEGTEHTVHKQYILFSAFTDDRVANL